MQKITYNSLLLPIYAETHLVSATSSVDSDVFIEKKEGFVSFDLKILNEELKTLVNQIYKVSKLRKGYKVVSNTSNICGTNVYDINGTPMYFKIISTQLITKEQLDFLPDVIEYNGNFYTNKEIDLRTIDSISIFTEYVLNFRDVHAFVDYKIISNKLTFTVDVEGQYSFKCFSELPFTPQLLNDYAVRFPNFEFNKTLYLEGDDIVVEKMEYLKNNLNILKPKNKLLNINQTGFIANKNKNYVIMPFTSLKEDIHVLKYKALISSHQFNIDTDITYFKLTPYKIELSTKEEADFSIELVLDYSKIKLFFNQFKKEFKLINKVQDTILCDTIPLEEKKIAFKKYKDINYDFIPSASLYVQTETDLIYMHRTNTTINSLIPTISTSKDLPYSQVLPSVSTTIEDVTFYIKD